MISLIISPYNHGTKYSFELTRWSHVIGGRFLSSVTVIALLLHFYEKIKSKLLIISLTTLLLVSTYFTGLRAGFLGLTIIICGMIVFTILKKKGKQLLTISISVFAATVLVLLLNHFNNKPTNRYEKMFVNKYGEFEDGAINARLIAYKASWNNIKKHPITGVGLGGFNNPNVCGKIAGIKYPHNLLIETQLEMGILGITLLIGLLTCMLWKTYMFSVPLFLFLLFSLWLSMFSKDIATQTQLWLGIALFGVNKKI